MRLIREDIQSVNNYNTLILALKLAIHYSMKSIIQNNKFFIEKLWLQIINKGCQNKNITKYALYCNTWFIIYLINGNDITKFVYKDEELYKNDLDNYLKGIRINNKSEDYKEIFGQALIHYCILLISFCKLKDIAETIKLPIQLFYSIISSIANPTKLHQAAYKLYAKYSQIIENELLLCLTEENNKDSLNFLLETKIKMIKHKIEGTTDNHHEIIETISCTLYSLNKLLTSFDISSISYSVKNFLETYESLVKDTINTVGINSITVTEFYHQISKCYLKVNAVNEFKNILNKLYLFVQANPKIDTIQFLNVIYTSENYLLLSKQLLWPASYKPLILILENTIENSLINTEKQIEILLNAVSHTNESIWEYYKLKSLFSSLSESSEKENIESSIKIHSKIVNLFANLLFYIDKNVSKENIKRFYAEMIEIKFLLTFKLYITTNSKVNIEDFHIMLLGFQLCEKDIYFNELKKYTKLIHLLIKKNKDIELSSKLFDIIMEAFTELINSNVSLEGLKDFIYNLTKLAVYIPNNDCISKFINHLLNSKDEYCQLSFDTRKLIYSFIKAIKGPITYSYLRLNPNCISCGTLLIDLYVYQMHNFDAISDITKIFNNLIEVFANSSILLYDAIIQVFELIMDKSQNVSLRSFIPLLNNNFHSSIMFKLETNSPQIEILIENINILEHIITELHNSDTGNSITILKGYFQLLDMKLSLIRSILSNFKWISFISSNLHPIHESISQTALKIYLLLLTSFKSLYGYIIEEQSFRSLYNFSIGNTKFVSSVEPIMQKVSLTTLISLQWYGNETVHMLRYLGYYKESQIILQYLVITQFYMKSIAKCYKDKEVYNMIVFRYITLLHELFEGYCNYTKDNKSKSDCMNYLLKCNEHYKDNIKSLFTDTSILDIISEQQCILAYCLYKCNLISESSNVCEMLLKSKSKEKSHSTIEKWILACRINIVSTKLMRSIGYTSELLEQIKRIVWASSSVVNLFNPSGLDQLVTNLHSWKFIGREIKIMNDLSKEELAKELSHISSIPMNNKYKVLKIYMNLMKNAANAYENYGMISHAEFYSKQVLKNPYVTPHIFLKVFTTYLKLNKTKCNPTMKQIMNPNESKSIVKIRETISEFINNFISLFTNIKDCPITTLISSIIPLLQNNSLTILYIPNTILIETLFVILEYLILYHTLSDVKEFPVILMESLSSISVTIRSSMSLISIHKILNLDYGKVLKLAFKQLLLSTEGMRLLNELLKILFNKDQVLDKTTFTLLAKNLSNQFSLLTGFTAKLRLLSLLYETIQQFPCLFSQKNFNTKAAYCYYMLYVCNFVYSKSKFYNIYSLWKFSALALLDFMNILSGESDYVEFFNLDECTFNWYPSQISTESIGIMHVSKLQHLFIEKLLKKRHSLDFGRQQAYYKFSLDCFSALNKLAPDIVSQRKRRSSLELTLISLNEEVATDFTGSVSSKAKVMIKDLSIAFEAGYTIVVLNSNLAEIASDHRKHLKLYLSRFRHEFDPIFLTVDNKASKELFNDFVDIIKEFYNVCDEAQNKKDPQNFWFKCNTLDVKLKDLLVSFEQLVLGPFKYLFLGVIREKTVQDAMNKAIERVKKKLFKVQVSSTHYFLHHLSVLFSASLYKDFTKKEVEIYIQRICSNCNENLTAFKSLDKEKIDSLVEQCIKECNKLRDKYGSNDDLCRDPVILILDSKLNNFPFESLPLIRQSLQPISRMPTMEHLIFACDRFNSASKTIDTNNAFFVLNPTKDLIKTQATFENYFTKEMHWKGIIGKEPKEQEIFKALEESELFIYCGHGAGEGIYSSEELRKIEVRSSALLMGCSSSFFSDNGIYESNGVTMAYLTSGSPLILGNLWDVTDRDIDRYLKALLNLWLKNKDCYTSNLLESVIKARSSCKMKYLIGAAPVCYGIPIHHKD